MAASWPSQCGRHVRTWGKLPLQPHLVVALGLWLGLESTAINGVFRTGASPLPLLPLAIFLLRQLTDVEPNLVHGCPSIPKQVARTSGANRGIKRTARRSLWVIFDRPSQGRLPEHVRFSAKVGLRSGPDHIGIGHSPVIQIPGM